MTHQIIRFSGIALLFLATTITNAQSVGIGIETPNSNAILELVAPNANQGLLVPRLTTNERTTTSFTANLSDNDNGLLVYDSDEDKFFFWMTDQWVEMASGNIDALPDQSGQSSRFLTTDGTNAQWSDIDFTSLINIPTGLSDGDDDTQLSDADISALGYIKNADDADADATNEYQDLTLTGNTLSLTNSTIDVDLSPFAGTNTDNQTLSLLGNDLSITGGNTIDISSINTNLTEVEVDAFANNNGYLTAEVDGSTSNEIQDISTDGTAGDISLTSGSSLTLNVNDADSDPTNEDQTVSAGTGISVNQVGDDFEVTNTFPDQTVSLTNGGNVTITGTYPNFTLSVPTNNDNSSTNEIELPVQTGQNGNFLSTDGTSPSWTSIDESQWNTNGTSINYIAGNVNIGAGTIPSSTLQLSTNNSNTTTPQLTLQESNASSDAAINLNRSGTNITMGIDATDGFFKVSGSNTLGSSDHIIMDNLGTVGVGVTPNAQFHVQTNSIEGTALRLSNTHSTAASKIGILNELDNQGTSIKTGVWNDISGTTGETDNVKGVYNIINPTDGITYGVHTQINAAGTGVRYGTFADVRGSAGNGSQVYGFRSNVDHDGSGDAYGIQVNLLGSTSGRQWGIYTNGEDFNYFEGNVGIGDIESDVELTIQSFNVSSTLPLVRLNSGAGTSDAGISYSISGGNEFNVGIDATDGSFKISDGATLGSGERFTVDASGNVGINQTGPSARLDVVGTSEFNGAMDVQNTLDVTGQLTVTNDIEIPAANDYTYATAQTRSITYHPTEFKLMRFDGAPENLVVQNFTNPYAYYSGGSGGLSYATVPVKLPDGAVVTQVDAWLLDNDATASNFARLNLYRSQIGVINSNSNMAQIETTSESASVQALNDNTLFFQTIDNANYSYRLLFSARDNSSLLQLHGVRITYTVLQVD